MYVPKVSGLSFITHCQPGEGDSPANEANLLSPGFAGPSPFTILLRGTSMLLWLATDDISRLVPYILPTLVEVDVTDELAVVAPRMRRFRVCREIIMSEENWQVMKPETRCTNTDNGKQSTQ